MLKPKQDPEDATLNAWLEEANKLVDSDTQSDSGSLSSTEAEGAAAPIKLSSLMKALTTEGSLESDARVAEAAIEATQHDALPLEKYLGICAKKPSKEDQKSYQPGSQMAHPIEKCMAPFEKHFGPETGKKVATLAILDMTQGGIKTKDGMEQKEISKRFTALPFNAKDFITVELSEKYLKGDNLSVITPNKAKIDTTINGFKAKKKFSTTFYNDFTSKGFDPKTYQPINSHICRLVTTSEYVVLDDARVFRSYTFKIEWPTDSLFSESEQAALLDKIQKELQKAKDIPKDECAYDQLTAELNAGHTVHVHSSNLTWLGMDEATRAAIAPKNIDLSIHCQQQQHSFIQQWAGGLNFTMSDLNDASINLTQLKEASLAATTLKKIGYSDSALTKVRYTDAELAEETTTLTAAEPPKKTSTSEGEVNLPSKDLRHPVKIGATETASQTNKVTAFFAAIASAITKGFLGLCSWVVIAFKPAVAVAEVEAREGAAPTPADAEAEAEAAKLTLYAASKRAIKKDTKDTIKKAQENLSKVDHKSSDRLLDKATQESRGDSKQFKEAIAKTPADAEFDDMICGVFSRRQPANTEGAAAQKRSVERCKSDYYDDYDDYEIVTSSLGLS